MVKDTGVPVVCCGEKMHELIPGTTDASMEKHVPVYTVEICLSNCLRCPHIYCCAFRPCCGYYPYLLLCNTVNSRSLL